MRSLRERWDIALVLVSFLALGVTYSVVTPLFEAPDEIWHYLYVRHLAEGRGLPVLSPANPGPWRQEGSQPPLYYLAGALLTSWVDTGDAAAAIRYNPYAAMGDATADGNKNVMVHTAHEAFPYHGTALAAHLVRLLSVALGAGTVLGTYLIAREIFPRQRAVAAGAAAIVAFNPQFLFLSGAVSNDAMVTALSALALLLLIRAFRADLAPPRLIALGVVVGLAALAKLSGLALLPLMALALAAAAWRRGSLRAFFGWSAALFLPALAVGGWWYARNWLLYQDPLGITAMLAVFSTRSYQPSLGQLLGELEGLRRSFWAVFGWFNVLAEPWVYTALDVLSLLGAAGLVVLVGRAALGRGRSGDRAALPWLAVLALWLAITLAGLARWTQLTQASQGRLLFPVLPAVGVLLFAGLAQWLPGRLTTFLATGMAVSMLAFAATMPFLTIAPAYARPPAPSPGEIAAIPHSVGADFGKQIRLLGYDLDRDRVRPGETLELTLFWQGLAPMEEDYSVFIHLAGEHGVPVAQRDSYPGRGSFPTSQWPVGVTVRDTYRLAVPPTAEAPRTRWLVVGLYNLATGVRLAASDREGRPLGDSLTLKSVMVLPKTGEAAVPNPMHAVFGGEIALVGFELEPHALRPGQEIHLALYWQALAPIGRDYTVFTHLLGEGDQIWAQEDSQPLKGSYPTSRWQVGEVIRVEYTLTVREGTPPGAYPVEVGLYLLATGERLPLTGKPGDNRILLGPVVVGNP